MKKLLFVSLIVATGTQAAVTTTQALPTEEPKIELVLRKTILTAIAQHIAVDPAVMTSITENSDIEKQLNTRLNSLKITANKHNEIAYTKEKTLTLVDVQLNTRHPDLFNLAKEGAAYEQDLIRRWRGYVQEGMSYITEDFIAKLFTMDPRLAPDLKELLKKNDIIS